MNDRPIAFRLPFSFYYGELAKVATRAAGPGSPAFAGHFAVYLLISRKVRLAPGP
jgi:hypothetical protein